MGKNVVSLSHIMTRFSVSIFNIAIYIILSTCRARFYRNVKFGYRYIPVTEHHIQYIDTMNFLQKKKVNCKNNTQ